MKGSKIDVCLLEAGWVTVLITDGLFKGFIHKSGRVNRNVKEYFATVDTAREAGFTYLANMN